MWMYMYKHRKTKKSEEYHEPDVKWGKIEERLNESLILEDTRGYSVSTTPPQNWSTTAHHIILWSPGLERFIILVWTASHFEEEIILAFATNKHQNRLKPLKKTTLIEFTICDRNGCIVRNTGQNWGTVDEEDSPDADAISYFSWADQDLWYHVVKKEKHIGWKTDFIRLEK